MAATATIRDVELVSVGTWAASTGVTKITRADLESCLAAHADGLVDHAPIKLGHESGLNGTDLGDGAPAYGWVVPTRIGTNKAGLETLYGDLVGIPSKLAAIAPTAYRRRSVEIAWGVKTPGGKTYAAALIGIALLGAAAPAVKGLADIAALYTAADVDVDRTATVELVEGLEANPAAVAMLAAARNTGATLAQLDAYAAAAGARDTADVPPPAPDGDDDDTETTTADRRPQTGRTTMTDEELRAALNLEADADVNAALEGLLEERTAPEQTTPPQPGQEPSTPAEEQPAEEQPAEAPAEESTQEPELVSLSAANYTELTRLAEESRQRRRNDALDTAVREGRIAPAERAAFAASMAKDEAGTIELLGQLSPGKFPTSELGADNGRDAATLTDTAWDAFEADTFGLDRSAQQ